MKNIKPHLLLGFVLFLLSGCCGENAKGGGCSSCPCERPKGAYLVPIPRMVDIMHNLKNSKMIMQNESGTKDTIIFGQLTFQVDTSISSSDCNQPHSTCCRKDAIENYQLPLNSRIITKTGTLTLNGRYDNNCITGNLRICNNDSLKTATFKNQVYGDAFMNIKSSNDTLSLFSVSKGFLILTDENSIKWKRVF